MKSDFCLTYKSTFKLPTNSLCGRNTTALRYAWYPCAVSLDPSLEAIPDKVTYNPLSRKAHTWQVCTAHRIVTQNRPAMALTVGGLHFFSNVGDRHYTRFNVQHHLKLNITRLPVKSGSMLRWIVPRPLCAQHH